MSSPDPHHAPPPPRVLIADDEPLVLSLLLDSLSRLGWNAYGARDGDELLAAFTRDPAAVDVVLLDACMPGPRLPEIVHALRSVRSDLPLVVMSGDVDSARDALGGEPVAWLPKPFRMDDLAAAARRAGVRERAA